MAAVRHWKDNVLDVINANFQDKDIFILDENGNFYKMLPNSTHVLRGKLVRREKAPKIA